MRTLLALLLTCSFAFAAGKDSSVVVVFEQLNKSSGHGSGVCVGNKGTESLILTNRHVMKDADKLWIVWQGKLVKGTLVYINDGKDDVGMFSVPVVIPMTPLATVNPQPGDLMKHFGTTSGPQVGMMKGEIEFTYGDGTKRTELMSDMLSIAGDSGAGVYNSKDELIALNTGRIGDTENGYQLGVPVAALRPILANNAADWNVIPKVMKKP